MPMRPQGLRAVLKRPAAYTMLATALAVLTSVTRAQELPVFRQGLWEFTRTAVDADGKKQTMTTNKCSSPTDEMKKQNKMLTDAGCHFSPVTKRGTVYDFTAQCTVQGVRMQSKSVIVVHGDSAYDVTIQTEGGGQHSRERLVAKRMGECH